MSDGEHRDEENHERKHARQQDVREVYIIIEYGVADGMRIDHNRLQKRHGLSVGRAFGEEHRAGGRATHQLTHRAHVLVEERTGHQIGVVRVERHLRRLLAQEFSRRSFGNVVESIDFAASHGRGGLGERSTMRVFWKASRFEASERVVTLLSMSTIPTGISEGKPSSIKEVSSQVQNNGTTIIQKR